MRQFDLKNNWLDLEGKPLAGRVSFCKLHTTDLENIYDVSGNVLDNPIFTNTIGQLVQQVFLKDRTDYTVRFEQYVGNGDMMTDPDGWLFQYSCDALWDTFGIEVDSTTFQLVDNIADLRLLDPALVTTRDERKVVILGGYHVIGDKPQVTYVWNPTSIESDNGGSVIKVATIATGRWELVNTFGVDGVDVRHFGVFGEDSAEDAGDTMSLMLGYANDYANSIGLPLYFPAIDGLTWYKVNSLNIYGAIFANETRVFGNSETSSVITVVDPDTNLDVYESETYGARFTIAGKEVHTSWATNAVHATFAPTYRLVIDSAFTSIYRAWTGIIVDVLETVGGCYFTDCIINSNGKLTDRTRLKTCKVTERMFNTSTDFATVEVFSDDEINLDDFKSVANWLTLIGQIFSGGEIDFKGRTVNSSCELNVGQPTDYLNAKFDGFAVKQSTVSFKDCTGTITTGTGNGLVSIAVVDSTLNITDFTVGVIQAFGANRSTVAFNTAASFTNVALNYSVFAASAYRPITNFSMANSTLNSAITVNGSCICENSNISGQIATSAAGFSFIGCRFNAPHVINVVMLLTKVVGAWVDNVGTVENPVQFNVTTGSLLADDSAHEYSYSGNTGTFLPTTAEFDVYFGPTDIDNSRSGSYDIATLGRCTIYIKDSKDIIMAYPWPNSAEHNVFHIGSETKYEMTINTQIDYQTFTTNRLRIGVVLVKDYVGDRPNANWLAGYLHLPIVGRLDNNNPTAIAALFRVSIKVVKGQVLVDPVG